MKSLAYLLLLSYLRLFAKMQLAKIKPTIIGVAGSSGKTSLGKLIYEVLQDSYTVKNSEGKNSETGLPLNILGISMKDTSFVSWIKVVLLAPLQLALNWKKYDYYIAEMGIDSPIEPKNMSYLLKIFNPTIGVVTNVSLEHSVYFEPYAKEVDPKKKEEEILEMTAREETLLLKRLPKEGTAIINKDDRWVSLASKEVITKKITVSLEKDADLSLSHLDISLEGFVVTFEYQQHSYTVRLPQPLPSHFATEILLALAVGVACNIDIEKGILSLQKNFSLPPGRLSFFRGIKHTILIDSTYNNATLPPILDILEFVKGISGKRRKVAIIGDMRELGEQSKHMHEEMAKKLIQTVDFAILIGPLLEKFAVPILKEAQFPFENFPHVTSAKEAILHSIKEGDVILVKGSQNTLFLERVVEMLLEDKKDAAHLTRRGEFWDKKREQTV